MTRNVSSSSTSQNVGDEIASNNDYFIRITLAKYFLWFNDDDDDNDADANGWVAVRR